MKKILFTIFISLGISGFSQNYIMTNGNVSTCGGTFYDNGFNGNYTDNANLTYTICSNTPGFKLIVNFTTFDLESGFDYLCIYDGNNAGSTLLGCFSSTSLANQEIRASGGCLTFRFTSDNVVTRAGWRATISCKPPCQAINPIISSVIPAPTGAGNDIKICLGDPIQLSGSATFPQNNTFYAQSIATSTFEWYIGGGIIQNGQNTVVNYSQPSKNEIFLVVKDVQGCSDTVKVASASAGLRPSFSNITFSPHDTICFDDTTTISIAAVPTPFTLPPLGVAGVTFLPDGNGQSYTSTLNVNIFNPGATYRDGFLKEIFLEMEHSYLGDLEIEIICPNNQSATLKEYPGGGATHLGEPIDQGTSTAPGVGYMYSFSTNPTYGTMLSTATSFQHTYTDLLGYIYNNQNFLPAGSYKPFESFNSALIGCPLNGVWSIKVTDHLLADDGYIFKWGLLFSDIILPDTSGYSILPNIIAKNWTPDPNIVLNPDDSTIVVSPTTPGSHNFIFNITDDWGCSHDTTIEVYVKPRYTADAGPDDITCNLAYNLTPVPHASSINPVWNYTTSSGGTAVFNNPNTSNATVTASKYAQFKYIYIETVNGCLSYPDTVTIDHIQLLNTIDIKVDYDTICLPQTVTFTNASNMANFSNILWEFGDGIILNGGNLVTHDYTNENCYDVKITLSNAMGCQVDSVLTNLVCAYDYPKANFTFAPYEPIVPETNVNFTNLSLGNNLSYNWDFDGLGSSTFKDPSFIFPITGSGNYPVKLVVQNIGGCKDSLTRTVVIKNPLTIYVPNSFTPNGDGFNDDFFVVLTNEDLDLYEFRIFDRWGNTIFNTSDMHAVWDGKFDGEKVQSGIYTYQLRWKELGGVETQKLFGHITLMR